MNWYSKILVGNNDIRLPKNHVYIERVGMGGKMNESLFRVADDPKIPRNSPFWMLAGLHQNPTYYRCKYVSHEKYVIHLKVDYDNAIPFKIEIRNGTILATWGIGRIGPTVMVINEDGVSCRFYANGIKWMSWSFHNLKRNKYVDPYDTDFFIDDIIKLEMTNLLMNNGIQNTDVQDRLVDLIKCP